jgi:hypothetical protein
MPCGLASGYSGGTSRQYRKQFGGEVRKSGGGVIQSSGGVKDFITNLGKHLSGF